MSGKELDRKLSQIDLSEGHRVRYGENPDQEAWVYQFPNQEGIASVKIKSAKEMSYNNYEDATVAYRAAQNFSKISTKPGVVIIKHGSLCTGAIAPTLLEATQLAWQGDSKSAFGGVLGFTTEVTKELIDFFEHKFIEVMVAPSFDKNFVEWANSAKPNLRLIQLSLSHETSLSFQGISGGILVQTVNHNILQNDVFKKANPSDKKKKGIVTERGIEPVSKTLFVFGVAAVRYGKSNAIAIVRQLNDETFQVLGMGVGQPNRVDSLERLAIPKAIENLKREHSDNSHYDPKIDLAKCVMASDGFIPFPDSIECASQAGLRYCIQPGGGIRDAEVIKKADELKICMIFTGERYFFH